MKRKYHLGERFVYCFGYEESLKKVLANGAPFIIIENEKRTDVRFREEMNFKRTLRLSLPTDRHK